MQHFVSDWAPDTLVLPMACTSTGAHMYMRIHLLCMYICISVCAFVCVCVCVWKSEDQLSGILVRLLVAFLLQYLVSKLTGDDIIFTLILFLPFLQALPHAVQCTKKKQGKKKCVRFS
jgi:hypothetical protein